MVFKKKSFLNKKIFFICKIQNLRFGKAKTKQ